MTIDFKIVQAYIAYRGGLPEEAGAALRRIEEQYEDLVVRADERQKMIDEYGQDLDRLVREKEELKEQLEAAQATQESNRRSRPDENQDFDWEPPEECRGPGQ